MTDSNRTVLSHRLLLLLLPLSHSLLAGGGAMAAAEVAFVTTSLTATSRTRLQFQHRHSTIRTISCSISFSTACHMTLRTGGRATPGNRRAFDKRTLRGRDENANAFGDFDDGYEGSNYNIRRDSDGQDDNYYNFIDGDDDDDDDGHRSVRHGKTSDNKPPSFETTSITTSPSTFYSRKSISDPIFSIMNNSNNFNLDGDDDNKKQSYSANNIVVPFQQLCRAANIDRPSRIQSLAWPSILRGESCVVADQTGSGKTFSYLLPLLQRLQILQNNEESSSAAAWGSARRSQRLASPKIVILTPTAELADQIHSVCKSLRNNLSSTSSSTWDFQPSITTATRSHSTSIRIQDSITAIDTRQCAHRGAWSVIDDTTNEEFGIGSWSCYRGGVGRGGFFTGRRDLWSATLHCRPCNNFRRRRLPFRFFPPATCWFRRRMGQ